MKGSNLTREAAWWPAYAIFFVLFLVVTSVGCHAFASGLNIPELSPISIFSHQTIAEEGGVAVGQNGSYSMAPVMPDPPVVSAQDGLPVSKAVAVFLFGAGLMLITLAIIARVMYPFIRAAIARDVAQLYKPVSQPVIVRRPTDIVISKPDSIRVYQEER